MLVSLLNPYRDKAPGQRECDEAIEVLNNCIREVDQASLAAISQQLAPRDDISHEVCVVPSEFTPITYLNKQEKVEVLKLYWEFPEETLYFIYF